MTRFVQQCHLEEMERMFEGMGNYKRLAFGSLCLRCEVCATKSIAR